MGQGRTSCEIPSRLSSSALSLLPYSLAQETTSGAGVHLHPTRGRAMARHRKVHMAPWRKPSYKVRSMRSVTQCSGRREQTRQRGQNCCRARNSKAPRRRAHRALREGGGQAGEVGKRRMRESCAGRARRESRRLIEERAGQCVCEKLCVKVGSDRNGIARRTRYARTGWSAMLASSRAP